MGLEPAGEGIQRILKTSIEWEKILEQEEKDRQAREDKRRLEYSQIPDRYREARIEKILEGQEGGHAVQSMVLLFKERKGNIYIHGPTGTGKTYLSCAYANGLIRRGQWIKFKEYSELLLEYRHWMYTEKKSQKQFVSQYTGNRNLIIDDFATGKKSESVDELVWNLVDSWWSSNSNGIILTSNYHPEKLPFEKKIISRIQATFKCVEMGGKDRRVKL